MNNSLQQRQQQSYNDKYSKETWISQYRNVKPSTRRAKLPVKSLHQYMNTYYFTGQMPFQ